MKREILTALKKSIKHWERLSRMVPDEDASDSPSSGHCPLCQMFVIDCAADGLGRCPVSKKTGDTSCDGTPYQEAFSAWHNCLFEGAPLSYWKRASKKMLRFLRSLLPKEE